MELSFGEQIKILLKRKNMTIKDLADLYTARTGTLMSRQNLTQRLKRDNFPEQDMHILAALLGYGVSIQLIPAAAPAREFIRMEAAAPIFPAASVQAAEPAASSVSPVQNIFPVKPAAPIPSNPESPAEPASDDKESITFQIPAAFRKNKPQGDINPLTGKEYLTNTVRRHPDIEEYVQVYDQTTHSWSDVREDYFWEFQEKKKQMLGADYQAPIRI